MTDLSGTSSGSTGNPGGTGSGPTGTGPQMDPFDPAGDADAAGLHKGHRARNWTAVIGVIAVVGLAAFLLVPSKQPTSGKGKAVAQAPAAKPDAKAAEPDKGKAEAAKPDAKKADDKAVAKAPAVSAPDKPADKAAPAATATPPTGTSLTLNCEVSKAGPDYAVTCDWFGPTIEWAPATEQRADALKATLVVTAADGKVYRSEPKVFTPGSTGPLGQVAFALAQ